MQSAARHRASRTRFRTARSDSASAAVGVMAFGTAGQHFSDKVQLGAQLVDLKCIARRGQPRMSAEPAPPWRRQFRDQSRVVKMA